MLRCLSRSRIDRASWRKVNALRLVCIVLVCVCLRHFAAAWGNASSTKAAVYPRLTGGLGNQMFILSAAAIIGRSTNRPVFVNARQTGVFSFGVPQPVFWSTVFHDDIFVKVIDYDEGDSRGMNEIDFQTGIKNNFKDWKDMSRGIYTVGAFLSFENFFQNRDFLVQLYRPSGEVQRWVNDAAVKLRIALPGKASSLPASHFDEKYRQSDLPREGTDLVARKHRIEESAPGGGWSCDWPPTPCDEKLERLECVSNNCKDNIALHIRLQDRSSTTDYWDQLHLHTALSFISKAIANGAHVVVFSNDLIRAELLIRKTGMPKLASNNLKFSSAIDVVEFYLMSQYFGTHILTGSSYQLWALFLTPLSHVQVKLMKRTDDDFGFAEYASRFHQGLYTFEEL